MDTEIARIAAMYYIPFVLFGAFAIANWIVAIFIAGYLQRIATALEQAQRKE